MYWRAIDRCSVPNKRHFGHTVHLDHIIWRQFLRLHLATEPQTLEHYLLVRRVRATWCEAYDFTFGTISPPPPPPSGSPPPFHAEREKERKRVDDLERHLRISFRRYRTLDDVIPLERRDKVRSVQNILPGESVARCMEALWRTHGEDICEAITWLGETAK